MTANAKFDLPNSGHEVIEKILHAYVCSGQQAVPLDEVASRAKMNKTQVSPNHGFLVAVGVLEGGSKKKLTDKGHQLALAISNNIPDDVSRNWAEIMQECEYTRKVLDMVRGQGGVSKSDMPGRVSFALGMASNKNTKTGVNCLIDIMLKAGLIVESDGKYVYNQEFDSAGASTRDVSATLDEPGITEPLETQTQVKQIVSESRVAPDPSVHIDVQIHIDANATPEQIDQIFASMAKYLYGRS